MAPELRSQLGTYLRSQLETSFMEQGSGHHQVSISDIFFLCSYYYYYTYYYYHHHHHYHYYY